MLDALLHPTLLERRDAAVHVPLGAGARGAHGAGVLGEVGNAREERRERPRVARVGDVRRELAQAPRHGFAHGLTVMCVFFLN